MAQELARLLERAAVEQVERCGRVPQAVPGQAVAGKPGVKQALLGHAADAARGQPPAAVAVGQGAKERGAPVLLPPCGEIGPQRLFHGSGQLHILRLLLLPLAPVEEHGRVPDVADVSDVRLRDGDLPQARGHHQGKERIVPQAAQRGAVDLGKHSAHLLCGQGVLLVSGRCLCPLDAAGHVRIEPLLRRPAEKELYGRQISLHGGGLVISLQLLPIGDHVLPLRPGNPPLQQVGAEVPDVPAVGLDRARAGVNIGRPAGKELRAHPARLRGPPLRCVCKAAHKDPLLFFEVVYCVLCMCIVYTQYTTSV